MDVTDGIFGVVLGSGPLTPLSLPFNVQYWLGIEVSGGSELSPRTILTSSAYSLNARSVADDAVTSASIADGAVTAARVLDGQIVRSVNGLRDDVSLTAGANLDSALTR